MANKIAEVAAISEAMQAVVERFLLRTIEQNYDIILALSPDDFNLLMTWANELPEPVIYSGGAAWWGSYQVLEDATVGKGCCRILIDGSTI